LVVNGSDLISNPWDTIWKPFIDIFGGGFWLIPIGTVALALYVKTREVSVSSIWLMISCFLVGSTVFSSHPEISFIYFVFTVIGLIGTVVSIFFMKDV